MGHITCIVRTIVTIHNYDTFKHLLYYSLMSKTPMRYQCACIMSNFNCVSHQSYIIMMFDTNSIKCLHQTIFPDSV